MLSKYWSKAQMSLYFSPELFELWPEDTFSFCPKCGMDNFELLYQDDAEIYLRCSVCNVFWVIKSALCHLHECAAVV